MVRLHVEAEPYEFTFEPSRSDVTFPLS